MRCRDKGHPLPPPPRCAFGGGQGAAHSGLGAEGPPVGMGRNGGGGRLWGAGRRGVRGSFSASVGMEMGTGTGDVLQTPEGGGKRSFWGGPEP